jgi:transcriptional regulator with XRE-family HTH domain
MSVEQGKRSSESPLKCFGDELRRLRDEAGMTQEELASIINYSAAQVSAVEKAKRTPREDFAIGCDAALKSGDRFTNLWREIQRRLHRPVLRSYFDLEKEAVRVRTFQPMFVPGLLQTEAYARAVIRGTSPFDDDDTVEARVTDRMERQSVLRGENAPTLLAIVEESLLRRPIGGPEVMREQLRHLADTAERPGVTVQVIPRTVGAYPGMEGPVVLLSFEATTDVAYLDHARGGELVNRPQDVVAVAAQFDALRAEALPRGASLDLIRKAAEEWT